MIERAKRTLLIDEGYRTKPYNDHQGNCTVGIGHLIHLGPCTEKDRSKVYTSAEIDLLLEQDVSQAVKDVVSIFGPILDKLTDVQVYGLVLMMFQLGKTRVLKFKNMINAVMRLDFTEAAIEVLDSDWHRNDTPKRAVKVARLLAGRQTWA